ncbi:MFS transporter [Ktedonobacter sp. SOSP1-52]|uniref:YbfB/YjiJ family MFS transporter n=1 Tax=Ktedonobacter sp. SOSP1-52 TaxID=2778366 RepID=UPI00191505C4|nr:YbfB/YjiJ family MFS transporter [Ktedonobacter sp. SOSP1-52]GHO64057.1 MFS transporter [Ktedonobacter sp. SOSP1-52]
MSTQPLPLLTKSSSSRTERERQDKPNSQSLVWWAAASLAVIVGFSRISYGLLLPSIRANLGGAYNAYGMVSMANFAGYLLGTLVVPLLLTRLHKQIMLNSAALLLMNGAMVGSALSLNLVQLSMWRFLVGFFSAIALVLTLSLTLERVEAEKRGRASGIVWMGASLGVSLSGLVAPAILNSGSPLAWRWVWIVMGASGGAAVIGLHRVLRIHNDQAPPSGEDRINKQKAHAEHAVVSLLIELLQPPGFLFATLSYVGYGFGYIIYLTFFVSLVVEQGLPSVLVGLIWAAMGIAGAVSGVVWGWAIDRLPTGFTLSLALVLGALGALSVLTHHLLLEAIGAALFGLSVFLGPPLIVTFLLRRVIPAERFPSSYSLLNTLFGIGQILGPLVGGFIVEQRGLVTGTAFTAVVLWGAALLALSYGMMQHLGYKQNATV